MRYIGILLDLGAVLVSLRGILKTVVMLSSGVVNDRMKS